MKFQIICRLCGLPVYASNNVHVIWEVKNDTFPSANYYVKTKWELL